MPPAPQASSAPTMMKVNVSGSLEIPIRVDLLGGLQDPVMEAEILKECARLSVSEQLGHFDAMDIDVVYDSRGQRACNVTLDLNCLGHCIDEIQGAYEHLLAHAQLLQALLVGGTPTPSTAENEMDALTASLLEAGEDATTGSDAAATRTPSAWSSENEAKMRDLVARMLAGPSSVVEAAAADHLGRGASSTRAKTGETRPVGDDTTATAAEGDDEDPFQYRVCDPDRHTAGKGLLDGGEEDSDASGDGEEDAEEPVDYEAMGYTRM